MSLTVNGCGSYFSTTAVNSSVYSNGTGSKVSVDGQDSTRESTGGTDTVQVSAKGQALAPASCLGSIVLPTDENVKKEAASLSKELDQFFSSEGISSQPPVEMSVDWSTGTIQIKGNRADSRQIQESINGNKKLSADIRNLAALSSQTAATDRSLKFELEYMSSNDPNGVVAKYSSLFSSCGQSSDISLMLDGDGMQVMSDGKAWISSAG